VLGDTDEIVKRGQTDDAAESPLRPLVDGLLSALAGRNLRPARQGGPGLRDISGAASACRPS